MGNRYTNINRFIINSKIKEFSKSIKGNEFILDAGGGDGRYRGFFKDKRYLAVDLGLERSSSKGLDAVSDICNLPFKDSSIDNIICIEVIEHTFEPEKMLKELNRTLKKGGKLLLTSPLCWAEHMQPYDFYRYTRFSLSKMLEKSGFKIKEISPRGGHFILIGYLISKIPKNISFIEKMPFIFKKPFKKILRLFFMYILSPVFIHMDFLDNKKYSTMGYLCEAEKIFSI